jgi:hypothetical protein
MIESLMLCGIGLLAGCLLMLVFFPFVHERAVRLTKRDLLEVTPLTASAIQADKDQLRAQFAVSLRRLEINLEEMRAKTASRSEEVNKRSMEINRLLVELDKKTALIFALRAREEVRKSFVRRTLKILLYLFARTKRRNTRPRILHAQRARLANSRP